MSLNAVLKKHLLKNSDMRFYLFSKPDYPIHPETGLDPSKKVLTLLIWVEKDTEEDGSEDDDKETNEQSWHRSSHLEDTVDTSQWQKAAHDCRVLLRKHGFDDAEVEIADREKMFSPVCFAVDPKDPAVATYELFSDKLVEELIDRLGNDWVGMSLFNVGGNSLRLERSRPEIVVVVRPYSRYDWSYLARRIKEEFIRKAPRGNRDFGVLFVPGQCGILPITSKMPGKCQLDTSDKLDDFRMSPALREWPIRGCSIGNGS